jgi:hypothetical protein
MKYLLTLQLILLGVQVVALIVQMRIYGQLMRTIHERTSKSSEDIYSVERLRNAVTNLTKLREKNP